MKNLIIKDLKNIRVIFIFYILTMTFGYSPFFIDLPKDRYDFLINSVFIYFTLLASMISVNFIITKNTNKGAMTNKLLRSLPIDARSVVGTSFILPILIFLIFSLPNILAGMGVSFMLGEKIIVNPFNLLLTFIIFYVYASITFSMAIIYPESSVVSYLRSVPLFILIIGLALVEKFMKNINYDVSNILNSLPLVVLILAVISIFILIVFYKFSLNKFIRKEL
ncbi:ABC-2 transporter permease [Clostridium perfringens]|uniref:ABC-2 transporter permease n=1 Tax=Clostridium perfringens TaxID=1502 RepID=UPI0018E4D8BC|nr:ABC-2 transporter permease [Clostridium perfringens]MBI6021693.1 ABC-2 transporter permease [Clostridium perfringens]